jgi:TolB protein
LVKADGSDLHQVAAGQPDTLFAGPRATGYNGKLGAAWSPDGIHIAFQTESDAATPIWETDVNPAAPRLLSTDCERLKWTCGDIWPAYSPDGKLLAFDRRTFDPDPSGVIAIRDLATGKVTLLESTRQGPPNQELGRAAWSPDGKQLAYYVVPKDTAGGDDSPLGTSVIYVVNADGTGVHTLETPGLAAGDPAWSPDGSLIVFSTTPLHEWESTGVDPSPDVYVIHPDGTGLTRLTLGGGSGAPSWTSDGKILFSTEFYKTNAALWLMDADGTHRVRIGPGSMDLLSPVTGYTYYAYWQPMP